MRYKADSQLEKAKNCFKKAIRLKPEYFEAIYNLGGIYTIQKKYEKAILKYKQALKYNMSFADALNNMAATYNLMNKIQ